MEFYKKVFINIFVFLMIYEINLSFNIEIANRYNFPKRIFTFWEPKGKIPGYLRLCIKTWKKFFPDYEIQIMDYKKLRHYLGETLFSDIICKNMALSMQADAIRVALLKKYGGIWMDTDMGFIFASNNSSILNEWLNQVIEKVKYYKNIMFNQKNYSSLNNSLKEIKSFDYLGNKIIDPILENINNKKYLRVESDKINSFPERKIITNSSIDNKQKYKLFYFQKGEPQIVIKKKTNVILLHNSWTPLIYKKMTEHEFLKQDILLSKLFVKILDIKLKS